MLKNDARNDASFNKRENWTKIEKIVNFIYYPNKIDPFVKNGFFLKLYVLMNHNIKPENSLPSLRPIYDTVTFEDKDWPWHLRSEIDLWNAVSGRFGMRSRYFILFSVFLKWLKLLVQKFLYE